MPRKRRRSKKRLQRALTAGQRAWFAGEEPPPRGSPAYGDWLALEYFSPDATISALWAEARVELGLTEFPQRSSGQVLFLRRLKMREAAPPTASGSIAGIARPKGLELEFAQGDVHARAERSKQ